MARSAVLPLRAPKLEIDIFSNKSSLILFWLLVHHKKSASEGFSVNELGREADISIGLVHKVIKQLDYNGIVSSKGLRTNKKFYLKSPSKLLVDWVKEYSIIKKAKSKGFSFLDLNLKGLDQKKLGLIPALHTAAEKLFDIKTTNLHSKEYYILDWDKLPKIVYNLDLQELDRGYEILFIKPYYPALLEKLSHQNNQDWLKAYALLTVLDLCHFPLRGVEQAESLFRKSDFLKSICSWSEIENAIG